MPDHGSIVKSVRYTHDQLTTIFVSVDKLAQSECSEQAMVSTAVQFLKERGIPREKATIVAMASQANLNDEFVKEFYSSTSLATKASVVVSYFLTAEQMYKNGQFDKLLTDDLVNDIREALDALDNL